MAALQGADPTATPSGAYPVAVVILAKDEELNLKYCLDSVFSWAAELHVVDSGSTDSTVEIARQYGAIIDRHDYIDHASQVGWALHSITYQQPWVLLLDADNMITPTLASQIQRVVRNDPTDTYGYYVRHVQLFRGRPVRGIKPWWLRLVRPERVRVDVSEKVDFRLVGDGRPGRLTGAIVEYQRKDNDLNVFIDKHQRFAVRLAQEEAERRAGQLEWLESPRLLGTPDQRLVWLKQRWYQLPLFVRPILYFGYRYIVCLGFLDGRDGFMFHFIQALWFRMLVDAHISDLEAPRRKVHSMIR